MNVSDGDGYGSASAVMCTGCGSVISLDAWSSKRKRLKDNVSITDFLHSLLKQ